MFRILCIWAALMIVPGELWSQEPDRGPTKGPAKASGSKGVVVCGGMESAEAGLEILKKGGNAVDGAVATIFAMSVTDSTLFCFGGEVPIMVYDAKTQRVEVIAGQGAAPKLATREYFAKKPDGIPAKGLEPACVPAVLDACLIALDRHGTMTFSQTIAPTIRLLDRNEKPWHADFAKTLRRLAEAEASAKERKTGLIRVGDYFYRGPIAREIEAFCIANGGLLRYADLATHVSRVEEPVSADYRGHRVFKCGPWTQGPYALQTLRMLEAFDLTKMGHNSPAAIHVTTEAMRLALADRDVYYADPLFVDVPLRALLSDDYTALRRKLIDATKSSTELRPGDPRKMTALLPKSNPSTGPGGPANDTTTCVVADAEGNMVAATPSGWSGVVAGGTGVWLGTRLQSFNTIAGHPNGIEPGKRPRITLTPGLVLKDGKAVIGVSVAGGDGQDQAALQVLQNIIDHGLSAEQAVTSPRFATNHHIGSFRQKPPELRSLILNPEVGEATASDLREKGHVVTLQKNALFAPVVVIRDAATGRMEAAGDPRAKRHAAGY